MNDIAQKMRESVEKLDEEVEVEVETEEVEVEESVQYSETELEALDIGWNPEGKDKDGNTLSAEEFLARKPLFNKIKNQGEELKEIRQLVKELREDNKKIAEASIKEKQELLDQLKEEREKALDNLEVDEVRNLDKRIENVSEEIKKEPKESETKISPYWDDFVKDNDWAKNEDSAMYLAAEGMATRWLRLNGAPKDGNDKPMYDYIHEKIREEFPEKFVDKKEVTRTTKVASAKNRSTSNHSGKKQVTLADLPEDEREVVKVMMRATGKTEEEYLKNYEL